MLETDQHLTWVACRGLFLLAGSNVNVGSEAPQMSASDGMASGSCDLMDLHVLCLNGDGFTLKQVHSSTLGRQVRQMVAERLPSKPGGKLAIHHHDSPLLLGRTLREQGIEGTDTLSCTYLPTDLGASWRFEGHDFEGFELEGLTRIAGAKAAQYLRYLPLSLEHLTFGDWVADPAFTLAF